MIDGQKHHHFAAMTAQSTLPSLSPSILDAIDEFGDCCFRNENTASCLVFRRRLTEAIEHQINDTIGRLTLDIAERDDTIARLQRDLSAVGAGGVDGRRHV